MKDSRTFVLIIFLLLLIYTIFFNADKDLDSKLGTLVMINGMQGVFYENKKLRIINGVASLGIYIAILTLGHDYFLK
jgi:hypothetical protein